MQISEQNLTWPQHLALAVLRLFHFYDHFSASKYFLWCVDDFSSGSSIFVVCQARADASGLLNNNPVAVMRELGNCGRRQADAKFVVFGFFWRAN